jgi:hypothetical protein
MTDPLATLKITSTKTKKMRENREEKKNRKRDAILLHHLHAPHHQDG